VHQSGDAATESAIDTRTQCEREDERVEVFRTSRTAHAPTRTAMLGMHAREWHVLLLIHLRRRECLALYRPLRASSVRILRFAGCGSSGVREGGMAQVVLGIGVGIDRRRRVIGGILLLVSGKHSGRNDRLRGLAQDVWCERDGHEMCSRVSSVACFLRCPAFVVLRYYTFKSLVLSHTSSSSMGPLSNLAVASVAGVVNVFMTLPIWLVNTRMAVAPRGEYTGLMDALRKIHAEEGLKGFYRGLTPSLILVSNPAIQFFVYEQSILLYTKAAQKAAASAVVSVTGSQVASAVASAAPARLQLSSLQYFLLGAFAKAVATVATYPYQVIKSRLQASRTSAQSTWTTILHMWREEGIGSFFRGMNAKISQTVLNAAFTFSVYESLVRIILRWLTWLRSAYAGLPKPMP
jgi:hypothetical protein